MKREWKPGDVAMVTFRTMPSGQRFGRPGHWIDPGSHVAIVQPNPGGTAFVTATGTVATGRKDVVSDARPLVVIDPEDREQVKRLYDLYYGNKPADQPVLHLVDQMQAALREFAAPRPDKPEEPTGLGAVVEDADGTQWIYVDRRNGVAGWHHCDANRERPWRFYEDIAAVRVLSEGVTP